MWHGQRPESWEQGAMMLVGSVSSAVESSMSKENDKLVWWWSVKGKAMV
jgi:hypothetical protein